MFFFAFFFSGFILKTTDNQIKPAETNTKTEEREKKVNTEEEEFERTRKNKYKRENDDQRFYHLVLAECEIDDGFFIVKKVVFFV